MKVSDYCNDTRAETIIRIIRVLKSQCAQYITYPITWLFARIGRILDY